MREPKTIADIMQHTWHAPIIEPVQRVKSLYHVPRGQRNAPEAPRYIWHRFPIKGGITGSKLMAENLTCNNTLLKALCSRVPKQ